MKLSANFRNNKEVSLKKKGQMHIAYRKDETEEQSFELLFKSHFKALYAYAFTILKDDVVAEEIVQNVFLKLWEKKEIMRTTESLKSYLYKCIYHDSLNYLRHLKVKHRYEAQHIYQTRNALEPDVSVRTEAGELQEKLRVALNELPQQCRTVFQMSRFENLKYREIAERLNISVKTVEIHMSKALKILRYKLADFLPVILYLFSFIHILMMKK